jgi:DNA-binding PadR family transcriptional regulator
MSKEPLLGQSELLVLLAVLRLGEEAYGVPISREIAAQIGREMAIAGIYSTLERLQRRGLIRSEQGEPTAVRGGRAKTYFRVTAEGVKQVRASQRTLQRLWADLPELGGRAS